MGRLYEAGAAIGVGVFIYAVGHAALGELVTSPEQSNRLAVACSEQLDSQLSETDVLPAACQDYVQTVQGGASEVFDTETVTFEVAGSDQKTESTTYILPTRSEFLEDNYLSDEERKAINDENQRLLVLFSAAGSVIIYGMYQGDRWLTAREARRRKQILKTSKSPTFPLSS